MDMVIEKDTNSIDLKLKKIELYIPKWVETLPSDHPVKKGLIEKTREILKKDLSASEIMNSEINRLKELEFVSNTVTEYPINYEQADTVRIRLDVEDSWYYDMLSNMTGVNISGEYQLIGMIRELSSLKEEYLNAKQALLSVRNTGYGVIMPSQNEIKLEEPVVIRQGSKFGVKIKASCPSVHLIKTEIETEISPIVGSEEQAQDLISYIKDSSDSGEGIWETNIFGKSIEQLTQDGIRTKLSQIGEESQQKLQNMMQRIVNETSGGFICIIL